MIFLILLRRTEFYSGRDGFINKLLYEINKTRCDKIQLKLGFDIGYNVFGYGLVLPHHGTIVVGSGNRIGNYCVLHTSTCITTWHKVIGDGLYVSAGAKIKDDINLGDYVSIGANAMVNKHCDGLEKVMIAGNPAHVIKESGEWWVRDGEEYIKRVKACKKNLKIKLFNY